MAAPNWDKETKPETVSSEALNSGADRVTEASEKPPYPRNPVLQQSPGLSLQKKTLNRKVHFGRVNLLDVASFVLPFII